MLTCGECGTFNKKECSCSFISPVFLVQTIDWEFCENEGIFSKSSAAIRHMKKVINARELNKHSSMRVIIVIMELQ